MIRRRRMLKHIQHNILNISVVFCNKENIEIQYYIPVTFEI